VLRDLAEARMSTAVTARAVSHAPPLVPPAEPAEPARIAELMRSASFEATRPSDAEIAALAAVTAPGTPIYVSAVPSRSPAEQIAIAKRLHARAFEAVPHLAARNFESAAALDHYLARMVDEAGVRRLLVIGGDRDVP